MVKVEKILERFLFFVHSIHRKARMNIERSNPKGENLLQRKKNYIWLFPKAFPVPFPVYCTFCGVNFQQDLLCTRIHIHTHSRFTNICVCVFVCVYARVCACVRVCVYVCEYVHVCVRACIYLYIYIHTTYMCTHAC